MLVADLWRAVLRQRDGGPVGCEVESAREPVDVDKVGPVNPPLSVDEPWHPQAEPLDEPPHVDYGAAISNGPRRGLEPTRFGVVSCRECGAALPFGTAHFCNTRARAA